MYIHIVCVSVGGVHVLVGSPHTNRIYEKIAVSTLYVCSYLCSDSSRLVQHVCIDMTLRLKHSNCSSPAIVKN